MCGWLTVGIVIFMLPVLSDTTRVKESLIEQLEEMVGGPIQIATMNLHLFPIPKIYLEEVSVKTLKPDAVTFRANLVEVVIAWKSFWNENLSISRVVLDQPELRLELPLSSRPEEPMGWQFPAIQELTIRKGRLHLLRKSADQSSQTLDWERIQLTITQTKTEEPSLVRLTAQIPDPQHSSTLILNGTVKIHEKIESFPDVEVQGQLEVSQLRLGRLVQFLRGRTLETPIQTRSNFQGDFSLIFQENHDILTYQNFQFSLDDWSLTGQGSITNIFHNSPWLNVSVSTHAVAIERLPDLVPDDWIPTAVQTFLRDHQVAGTMELQSGVFRGPLDGQGSWEANGVLILKDGQILPSPDQPFLTGVSGSVTFSPSTIQFSQIRGHIAPLTMLASEATMKLEEEAVHLSVPSLQISEGDWLLDGNVEFSHQQNSPPMVVVSAWSRPISIQRFSTILPQAWFPSSVQDILMEQDIDGEIELLTGSVKWIGDEANTLIPEGVFRIAKGTIQVDPNHPPLTNVSGEIVLESDLFRFLNVQATIAASKIAVKEATLEKKDSEYWMDLQGKGLFSAHDVHQALLQNPRSQALLSQLSLYHDAQGKIHIASRIKGPLTDPSKLQILDGHLLLDDIQLFPTSNGLPVRQLNGQLSFDDQGIHIQRFNGQLGESPVAVKGQWSFQKDAQSSNLTFTSSFSSTDLQTLFPVIRKNFSALEGSIDTTMSFSGTTLRPVYQTKFDLTNTALTAKGMFHKPLGTSAKIELIGSIHEDTAVRMTKGTLSIPPYTLEAQGRVSWSDPPYIRGIFQTESGTGAMFPEGVIIGDGRLRISSLGITWGLEGKNWDWTTWAMKGKVEGSNRSSESTTSNTKEDVQSASFQWVQKNQKGKGKIALNGIPIESLLAPKSASPPPVTGTTSLKTSLHMNLESPEQMKRSLTGKGNVQLQKGLIQTGPVLSKIFGILNVPSLLMGKVNLMEEGLPFDELTGSFSIDKGLLTTKDLALKSPVLKLTAAGTYDFPTEEHNSVVAVSPFGAYSNLLKDIPLFGSLMKGERKGILTALFEVKGPRTNPEVTYLPMESITGGLKGLAQVPIDMLKNIIPLPLSKKEKTEQSFQAK